MWYAVRYTDPAAAAVSGVNPWGRRKMFRAGANTNSAYPPSWLTPITPYWLHEASSPSRQYSHRPQL